LGGARLIQAGRLLDYFHHERKTGRLITSTNRRVHPTKAASKDFLYKESEGENNKGDFNQASSRRKS
jgi:hypothetical protein